MGKALSWAVFFFLVHEAEQFALVCARLHSDKFSRFLWYPGGFPSNDPVRGTFEDVSLMNPEILQQLRSGFHPSLFCEGPALVNPPTKASANSFSMGPLNLVGSNPIPPLQEQTSSHTEASHKTNIPLYRREEATSLTSLRIAKPVRTRASIPTLSRPFLGTLLVEKRFLPLAPQIDSCSISPFEGRKIQVQ